LKENHNSDTMSMCACILLLVCAMYMYFYGQKLFQVFTRDLTSSVQFEVQWILASTNQGKNINTSDIGAWIWWNKCMGSCVFDEDMIRTCWWSSLWPVVSGFIMKISKL